MNWDAIGAIGEVVGAVTVFGTLVYLAVQLRIQNEQLKIQNRQAEQQNAEARLASNRQYAQSIADMQVAIAQDAEYAQLYFDFTTSSNWEDYDPVSATRVYLLWHANFRIWETAFYGHLGEQLDDRVWQPIERGMAEVIALPSFSQWWSRRSVHYSDDFARYVNDLQET